MGRFAPKYTEQQRQAIVRLLLDDGQTGPEVVRMSAAGELDGLDPFEIPLATVYDIAYRERKKREAEADAQEASTIPGKIRQLRRQGVEAAERELDRLLKAEAESGKLDVRKLHQIGRTLIALDHDSHAPTQKISQTRSSPTVAHEPEPPSPNGNGTDFKSRLEERHQATPSARSDVSTPVDTENKAQHAKPSMSKGEAARAAAEAVAAGWRQAKNTP